MHGYANSRKRIRGPHDPYNHNPRQHPPTRNEQQHQNINTDISNTVSPTATSSTAAISQVREIPGFYYDSEKKKYFKITADHLVRLQHPFSQQAIAEKTLRKPVMDPMPPRPKQSRVNTRSAVRDPSPYGRIHWVLKDRQLGNAGSPRRRLCEMHSLLIKQWRRIKDMELVSPSNRAKFTQLQVVNDASERIIYMGSSEGEIWRQVISRDLERQDVFSGWHRLGDEIGSQVTSLHRTSEKHLISTYLGSMERSGTLKIQKDIESAFDMPEDVLVYAPKKSNIWTSDYAGGGRIALGMDQKVVVIDDWRSRAGHPSTQSLWTGSDVFSVAIEPQYGQDLIYAGCRNGSVRIYDLRQPSSTQSSAAAFKKMQKRTESVFNGIGHKESSVHCLKRVSDHLLVTLAMNGEMSVWDTRFVGSSRMTGGSPSNENASEKIGCGEKARPMMELRGRVEDQFTKANFDVNAEATLLAAENVEQYMSIWSLRTGGRVCDMKMERDGSVGCTRFSEGHSGIYVTLADRVQYWGM
ncbi:hypothetical protein BGZ94_001352 [Podila epigama]|nr:hypothetical protein BGZ94_001352 [Podila epigama]